MGERCLSARNEGPQLHVSVGDAVKLTSALRRRAKWAGWTFVKGSDGRPRVRCPQCEKTKEPVL